MKRTLSLKRESLTPLTTDELCLLHAAGDQQPTPPQGTPLTLTLAPKECLEMTTQNSFIFCSGGCLTGGASCYC